MTDVLAVAAEADSSVSPLFFLLGVLALIIVSALGPLSRMHERREQLKLAAAARPADEKAADRTTTDSQTRLRSAADGGAGEQAN